MTLTEEEALRVLDMGFRVQKLGLVRPKTPLLHSSWAGHSAWGFKWGAWGSARYGVVWLQRHGNRVFVRKYSEDQFSESWEETHPLHQLADLHRFAT